MLACQFVWRAKEVLKLPGSGVTLCVTEVATMDTKDQEKGMQEEQGYLLVLEKLWFW